MNFRIALLVGLFISCAPETNVPVDIIVLDYNYNKAAYEPKQVQLETVTDIVAMEGKATSMIGGAELSFDVDVSGSDVESYLNAIQIEPGKKVKVSFMENDGVLIPADFHSLNIATTYYNFERSLKFFSKISGIKIDELINRLGVPSTYYFPTLIDDGEISKDNAIYSSFINSFIILPFEQFRKIPFSINRGVLGHEYGHFIFNYRVHDGKTYPPIYNKWTPKNEYTPGFNVVQSLEEGSADFYGVGVMCSSDLENCEPQFVGHSLPNILNSARRLDGIHCWKKTKTDNIHRDLVLKTNYTDFKELCEPYGCLYEIGTVFASSLWKAASNPQLVRQEGSKGKARKLVYSTLWRAQGDNTSGAKSWRELIALAESQSEFSFWTQGTVPSVLDAVVNAAGNNRILKLALCGAFIDRFRLDPTEITSCPTDALSNNECPW